MTYTLKSVSAKKWRIVVASTLAVALLTSGIAFGLSSDDKTDTTQPPKQTAGVKSAAATMSKSAEKTADTATDTPAPAPAIAPTQQAAAKPAATPKPQTVAKTPQAPPPQPAAVTKGKLILNRYDFTMVQYGNLRDAITATAANGALIGPIGRNQAVANASAIRLVDIYDSPEQAAAANRDTKRTSQTKSLSSNGTIGDFTFEVEATDGTTIYAATITVHVTPSQ